MSQSKFRKLKTKKKKILKGKSCQPRILYPAKISFRNETEIKASSDKRN